MKLFFTILLLFCFFIVPCAQSSHDQTIKKQKLSGSNLQIINEFITKKRLELKSINVSQTKEAKNNISEIKLIDENGKVYEYFLNIKTGVSSSNYAEYDSKILLKNTTTTYYVNLGYFYKDAYYHGTTRSVPVSFSSNGSYHVNVYNLGSLDVSSHRFPPVEDIPGPEGYSYSISKVHVFGNITDNEHYDYIWYDDNYDDECLAPSGYPKWLCTTGANDNVQSATIDYTVSDISPPPPPALSVSISGPTTRGYNQDGTWTANVSGGNSPYHYQWYYKYPCDEFSFLKIGPSPLLPPCGDWIPVGTNNHNLTRHDQQSFQLKCIVTDAVSSSDVSNILYVSVGAPKAVAQNQTISSVPKEFNLLQNYPNPFNPSTVIKYELSEASVINITLYDLLGRKVKELVNAFEGPGTYKINFNASNLSSGIYLYRIIAKAATKILFSKSKEMILLK